MASVVSESPTRLVYPYLCNGQLLYIRGKYEGKDTIMLLTFYRTRVSHNLIQNAGPESSAFVAVIWRKIEPGITYVYPLKHGGKL